MTTLQLASYKTTEKNPEPLYRLHRDNCKRLASAIIEYTQDADGAPSENLRKAAPCSKCKPTQTTLDEALVMSEARDTFQANVAADEARDSNLEVIPDAQMIEGKPEGTYLADEDFAVFAGPEVTLENGQVLAIRKGAYPEVKTATLNCLTCHTNRPAPSFPFVTRKGDGKGRLLECSKCWTSRIASNAILRREGKETVPAPRATNWVGRTFNTPTV